MSGPVKKTDQKRIGSGAPGPGRPKGSPNKSTLAVKEALIAAFDGMGGVNALQTWAMANETEFYKLWVKMLPQDVNANLKGNISLIQLVGVKPDSRSA